MPKTPATRWGANRRTDGKIDLQIGEAASVILSDHAALDIADMLRSMVLGVPAATDA